VLGETFGRSLMLPGRRIARGRHERRGAPVASIAVALTTFAVILLAELPDKTALASLVLGTRYRALPVLCGIAAGFAVHVTLAVVAGSLLSLLPHRILEIVVAVLFLAGAVVLLIGRKPQIGEPAEADGGTRRFWPGAAAAFAVIAVAEFGDLTQVVIANLVARYQDPIAVGVGAFAAMWTVAAAAVIGGRNLLRLVPVTLVTRAAAALMIALAGFTLAGTFG
jgi:Ca2+/H+ antiporter, TMEM165/GDT1 family